VVARYKQFYPEGLTFFIEEEGPEGIQLLEQFFQWPTGTIEQDVLIETRVSSASMSKSLRKQEIVALVDKMPQLYQVMMGMAQTALDPNNPAALVSMRLLQGFQAAVDEMMTEFEIGEKEILNPDLVQEVQVAQNIQRKMQELTQQVQQMGMQNQKLQQQLAQLQGVPPQGQQMGGSPVPPPGMGGPMPMGGPVQG
jgi:hypothetical protein